MTPVPTSLPSQRTQISTGATARFAAAAVLVVSAILSVDQLPQTSACWFKSATELPCPGCGLTRGFCSISHGELQAAWRYNPFSFVFYAAAVAVLIPRPRRGRSFIMREPYTRIAIAGLMMTLWIFGAWRILQSL
ncbi:MAG: DUF2752 domain-containing protein [Planctomycetota bacterium]